MTRSGKKVKFATRRHVLTLIAAIIIVNRPTYRLFDNNCQNSATFLLESLCPGAAVPDTIQKALERIAKQFDIEPLPSRRLPGAYPPSTTSGATTYVTASDRSWWTATGNEYFSTIECLTSLNEGDASSTINNFIYTHDSSRRNVFRGIFRGQTHLRTALRDAIMTQNLDTVIEVLQEGVNVRSERGNGGFNPLRAAIITGNDEIVQALLQAGANPSAFDGEPRSLNASPLLISLQQPTPNVRIVEQLMAAGADPLIQLHNGMTTLQKVFIDCDINIKYSDISCFSAAIIRVLRSIDSLVDKRDERGDTLLHFSLRVGNVTGAKVLINYGANLLCKNDNGDTMLHSLASGFEPPVNSTGRDFDEVVALLVKGGVAMSALNNEGYTCFHVACLPGWGDMGASPLILDSLCNYATPNVLDIEDGAGQTAYDYTKRLVYKNDKLEAEFILWQAGAMVPGRPSYR